MAQISTNFDGPSLEQQPLGSRPFAYVLSGGAALGAWQGGVLCALSQEKGWNAHSVIGTSAGAINGAAYLQGDFDLLKELWRSIPRGRFMKRSLGFSPPRLFSLESVKEYLGEVISEERCRQGRRCWFYPVSVDIAHGETLQSEFSPESEGPWQGPLIDKIVGSMAVPFVFPPARVPHEDPSKKMRVLVDGHVTSRLSLGALALRGVRDFVFVNVISHKEMRTSSYSPRGFISTMIHQLLNAQVDNGLEPFRDGFKELGIRAFLLRPSRPLAMSVFKFDKRECRDAFELGERDAVLWGESPNGTQIL
ncbi:MAG: hypothetical protein COB53_02370 [Elusimicrobia bacterium]|nr:MAG: hypothetical protein COB53_02370 [Elusimicrobiota bacterium]